MDELAALEMLLGTEWYKVNSYMDTPTPIAPWKLTALLRTEVGTPIDGAYGAKMNCKQ